MPTMPTLTHACVRLLRPVFGLVLLAPVPILGDTVFKSSGPDGTVYSDTPSPGSREIDLPLPNVAEPSAKPAAKPAVKPEASPQPDDAAPPQVAYQSLRITQPEDDGSAGDNTANFEVRVAVEPALRYQLGHAFVVTLNGRAVDRRYTSTEMLIPPEFFGDSIRANERFRLEVRIEDRDGRVLREATPVDFVMRHAAARPDQPGRPLPSHPGRR